MKIFLSTVFLVISTLLSAQVNRNKVFNKDLKLLVGNWAGNTVLTDVTKNNAQVNLRTSITVTELRDSVMLSFEFADPEGKTSSEKTSLYIDEAADQLIVDAVAYDIASTARRGSRLTVVAEKNYGADNNRVADLKLTFTFEAAALSIVKEVRYVENQFYFIRSRASYSKK